MQSQTLEHRTVSKTLRTTKEVASRIFMYSVMAFTVVVSLFPILWVIMSSFKTNGEIIGGPFVLPSSIDFSAYIYLFQEYNFGIYAFNSLLISSVSTVLSLAFFSMAAYVIARYKFPGSRLFFALFVITMLVPVHSRTQPIFSLIIGLDLYDTRVGLILVYLSAGLAMSMFILKAAFQAIPMELSESASIDGAGFLRIFFTVILPLARSGLTTAGVLMFLLNWNEFYYANLLVLSERNRTLPIVTILFNSMFSYNYTNTFAALTVVVIPGILIYSLASRQVQASLASTAIKG